SPLRLPVLPLPLVRAPPLLPLPLPTRRSSDLDFVVSSNLGDLVRGMNALTDEPRLDPVALEREIAARDREVNNGMTKDAQIIAIDRKSTRLNSSHQINSYAVVCLKKKNKNENK